MLLVDRSWVWGEVLDNMSYFIVLFILLIYSISYYYILYCNLFIIYSIVILWNKTWLLCYSHLTRKICKSGLKTNFIRVSGSILYETCYILLMIEVGQIYGLSVTPSSHFNILLMWIWFIESIRSNGKFVFMSL